MPDPLQPTPETTTWTGRPSLLLHPTAVILMVLCAATVVLSPIALVLWIWLKLKSSAISYELTSQRLRLVTGILSKKTMEIELFRVKDTVLEEPWLLRMKSLGNVTVVSSDALNPEVRLCAIPQARQVREMIREVAVRMRGPSGMVKEVEME